MIPKLDDYARIVGKETIEKIREEAKPLEGKHITHLNATSSGGGVAEILNSMVILHNELNILVGWRLLKGSHTFFDITKDFHNALQGEKIKLSDEMKRIYLEEIERNSVMNHLHKHDLVVIHDPQPLAMVNHYPRKQPWVWRCHIDITHHNPVVWKFLEPFLKKYNGMVVSMRKYKQRRLGIPQYIIHPSIDPLNLKNMDIPKKACKKILSRNGIDLDKPIICQVSRFDKWKNPMGVVNIYEKVRQKIDCQLVLAGDMAADDPEGPLIFEKISRRVAENHDIHLIAQRNDILVNALQRMSQVILQNSRREGFALTVTEAMYKETPVVARNRGGIPLQVINNKTGFLINSTNEGAKRVIQLLIDDSLRKRLGENGKKHVIKNFLITRQILDYLKLFNLYINGSRAA